MVRALHGQQGSESNRKAATFHRDVFPDQDVDGLLAVGGGFVSLDSSETCLRVRDLQRAKMEILEV
ncbi:MAG: hypothetical protein IKE42_23505 [Aquamicrobium sp.]|uniref:hypothetical protein n=1 Tax=Mesorhizobium sp. Pch-S TaxID=2082387 RepID=UPI0013E9BAE9|nr:hypothetical protein [Mesorhizobium sp. Pch-S]MBR2690832.1 hypothetical protein [Aquamicrobium sp.]